MASQNDHTHPLSDTDNKASASAGVSSPGDSSRVFQLAYRSLPGPPPNHDQKSNMPGGEQQKTDVPSSGGSGGQEVDSSAQSNAESSSAPDEQEADHSTILDRHNRAIAQILARFRNVVVAATEPLPQNGEAIMEHAALNRLTMETECAALIAEIQGLLAINREIKTLWIRGPLRQPGDGEAREAELDESAAHVTRLYDQVLAMRDAAIRRENQAKAAAGAAGGEQAKTQAGSGSGSRA
ncbi:hypothetical protein AAE478_003301 [Parahypoxylon ruwenzoriense]